MAQRTLQVPQKAPASMINLRNIMIAAGVLAVAPFVIRRLLALTERGLGNVTGNDLALAGKDGVRDAADNFNVGGVTGKLKRAGGRIADHLSTDL